MDLYQKQALEAALPVRKEEIAAYQVNIDNYTRAIAKIGDDPDQELQAFKKQLETLLASERREQRKAQLMHDVIQDQLDEAASAAPAP